MIHYKSKDEVELIKESADILGRAHGEVAIMEVYLHLRGLMDSPVRCVFH